MAVEEQPDIWQRVRDARDHAREQARQGQADGSVVWDSERQWAGLITATIYEAIGDTLDVILGEQSKS